MLSWRLSLYVGQLAYASGSNNGRSPAYAGLSHRQSRQSGLSWTKPDGRTASLRLRKLTEAAQTYPPRLLFPPNFKRPTYDAIC